MAAAFLVGNLALPIDGSSPRNERGGKIKPEMAAVNRAKREQPSHLPLTIDCGGRRKRSNSSSSSKIGAAASSSSSPSGGGDGDGGRDWEEELRRKLKDLEEMKELEKRAAELQSQIMAEEVEGEEGDETEEEKRERVRRELEKV